MPKLRTHLISVLVAVLPAAWALANVTNWESPHVHPIDLTPDARLLLAVNTPDNRLEAFTLDSGSPVRAWSAPVGVDPVTVRVRSNTQAWVVNHISDTISIVNLQTHNVERTLTTRDEPCDVVFVGTADNARALVSCQSANVVLAFTLSNLDTPPTVIPIQGQGPRAMCVSADGQTAFAAIFYSGNRSTILGGGASGGTLGYPPNVVNLPTGPHAGVNPPPNTGNTFTPAVLTPNPPRVGLIVKKDATGRWMDDNAGDWSSLVSGPNAAQSGRVVGWDLVDHDIAIIDSGTLSVSYATGLMNIAMAMSVNPASGRVTLVGTDATNQVRYEPVVNGTFLRVNFASVDASGNTPQITDLNPHLTYTTPRVPQDVRDMSLGDPRAIAWNASGTLGLVAGMGSSNAVFIDAGGRRVGGINVINTGRGPTGAAYDAARGAFYLLERFEAKVSVINEASRTRTTSASFYDPTPPAVAIGRTHLYDTRRNSGLGHVACASCHVDSRFDRLAWDLGNPADVSVPVSTTDRNLGQNLFGLAPGLTSPNFAPYHPMKGPMTTQTMQDIIGKEPHHWRGDRLGIEEFNGAFIGLQGDDANLTPIQMQEFEDYLSTITFPPNPFRNFDNSLPTAINLDGHLTTGRFAPAGQPLGTGNAANGLALYRSTTMRLDAGAFACVSCHTLPTGAGTDYRMSGPFTPPYVPIAPGPMGQRHLSLVTIDGSTNVTMKIPQLRNLYQKRGFNTLMARNTAGFGVLHDGSVDSIERFVSEPVFSVTSDQQVADLTAFMLAFSGSDLPAGSTTNPLEPPGPLSQDTHAAVGAQVTFDSSTNAPRTRISAMVTLANNQRVGLVAHGVVGGQQRGWRYDHAMAGGLWQSDQRDQKHTTDQLLALASVGGEITITVVPTRDATRLGIDRDLDGWFDLDEQRVCADPANPLSHPGPPSSADFNGDLTISVQDIFDFLTAWFMSNADFNASGATNVQDIFDFLAAWFAGCA